MDATKNCPACKNDNNLSIESCVKCDFPFNGTEKEKSIHIGQFIGKKGIIIDSEDSLRKTQIILYGVAMLFSIPLFVNLEIMLNNLFLLFINVLAITVIVVCGILLNKSPLLFLSIPLILLLTIYTSNYFVDPQSIYNGLLTKCIILGSLVYSIIMYVKSKKFKKQHNL